MFGRCATDGEWWMMKGEIDNCKWLRDQVQSLFIHSVQTYCIISCCAIPDDYFSYAHQDAVCAAFMVIC